MCIVIMCTLIYIIDIGQVVLQVLSNSGKFHLFVLHVVSLGLASMVLYDITLSVGVAIDATMFDKRQIECKV